MTTIGVVGTLCMLVVLLWAEWNRRVLWMAVAKPLASLGFILAALAGGSFDVPYRQALLAGLLLSWWGDVFLLSGQKRWFLAGIGAFAAAHLAYVVAFASRGTSWLVAMLVAPALVAAILRVRRWLQPHVSADMWIPVQVYMGLISAMVALALGATFSGAPVKLFVGAFVFYLSDLCVARDRFVTPGIENRLIGLPLYYVAQLLLATSG